MADGTTIERAMDALFGLCVPVASQGRLAQTFPDELVVSLTENEAIEYADSIADCDQVRKVDSPHGIILFESKSPWHRIVTADGNPQTAHDSFKRRLAGLGGWEEDHEDTGDGYEQWTAAVPLGNGFRVIVLFSAQMTKSDVGFFGSAMLAWKELDG